VVSQCPFKLSIDRLAPEVLLEGLFRLTPDVLYMSTVCGSVARTGIGPTGSLCRSYRTCTHPVWTSLPWLPGRGCRFVDSVLSVHHRQLGRSSLELLIALCPTCHALSSAPRCCFGICRNCCEYCGGASPGDERAVVAARPVNPFALVVRHEETPPTEVSYQASRICKRSSSSSGRSWKQ
jgi:hypothetical protein